MAAGDRRDCEQSDVWVVDSGRAFAVPDRIAAEEPLEIRITNARGTVPVAVTMRTPGNDRELAAGFLFSERVVEHQTDVLGIHEGVESRGPTRVSFVTLAAEGVRTESLARLERHFFASSACGVCGKSELQSLLLGKVLAGGPSARVKAEVVYALPQRLAEAQTVFSRTGGLHAAALFDFAGTCLAVREDVGRHNALDKLLGWALLEGRIPLRDTIVLVSGRASYELVQKCSMAEVPVLCALSAPSSLAVSLARKLGMTLIGFLRERRFNVYAGGEHVEAVSGG